MNGLTKALAAEFTGTFALIFLGAGAAMARTIGPAACTTASPSTWSRSSLGGTIAGVLYRVFWATRAESVQLKTGPVLAE